MWELVFPCRSPGFFSISKLIWVSSLFVFTFSLQANVLQRFAGFVLVRTKSESEQWRRVEQDVEISQETWFRTSREFAGRLLRRNRSPLVLDPSSTYFLEENRVKVERNGTWTSLDPYPSSGDRVQKGVVAKSWWILFPFVEAKISRENGFRGKVIKNSFPLVPGDRIRLPFESGAELRLPDGSIVRIAGGSILKVSQDRIDLSKGKVFCTVTSRNSRLEVVTPILRSSVRGTVFEVTHAEDSEVRVYEGVVKIGSRRGSRRSRFVQGGQRTLWVQGSKTPEVSRFDARVFPAYGIKPTPRTIRLAPSKNWEQESRSERIQRQLLEARKKGFDELSPKALRKKPRTSEGSISKDLRRLPGVGEDPEFRSLSGKKSPQGMVKEFQEWHDEKRTNSAEFRIRERITEEAPEAYFDQKEDQKRREQRAVGVRSTVRREGFEKGQVFSQAQKNGAPRRDREIRFLKSFLARKKMEIDRLLREVSLNDRERDRINKKISALEERQKIAPSDDRLQESFITLRVKKRELERERSFLNERRRGLESSVQEAISKLNRVTDASARGSVVDQRFQGRARELLRP
jgi:hypothetical protein